MEIAFNGEEDNQKTIGTQNTYGILGFNNQGIGWMLDGWKDARGRVGINHISFCEEANEA